MCCSQCMAYNVRGLLRAIRFALRMATAQTRRCVCCAHHCGVKCALARHLFEATEGRKCPEAALRILGNSRPLHCACVLCCKHYLFFESQARYVLGCHARPCLCLSCIWLNISMASKAPDVLGCCGLLCACWFIRSSFRGHPSGCGRMWQTLYSNNAWAVAERVGQICGADASTWGDSWTWRVLSVIGARESVLCGNQVFRVHRVGSTWVVWSRSGVLFLSGLWFSNKCRSSRRWCC